MPTGTVKWIDQRTGDGCITHVGRIYPVRIEDVEPAARVPRARVHFDVRRDHGVRRAANVTLRRGTRVSHRRHRYGDLVGAARPDEKGHAPLTHRHPALDFERGPQPMRVVHAWLDAMIANDVPSALVLYAPGARLYVNDHSFQGRRGIEPKLAASPLRGMRARDLEIFGEDGTVIVRWAKTEGGQPGGRTRIRVEHGRIDEQWL